MPTLSSSSISAALEELSRLPASDRALLSGQCPGLAEYLAWVPDPRNRRGVRHSLTSLLMAAVAAVLAGATSFTAVGEWVADAPPQVLAALGVRAAVEFRHDSWFNEDVYGVLRRQQAALVVTDQEKWPRAPRLELSGFAYYRLRRDYDSAALERWRRELRAECEGREEVHVYFRHDPESPARAVRLLEG